MNHKPLYLSLRQARTMSGFRQVFPKPVACLWLLCEVRQPDSLAQWGSSHVSKQNNSHLPIFCPCSCSTHKNPLPTNLWTCLLLPCPFFHFSSNSASTTMPSYPLCTSCDDHNSSIRATPGSRADGAAVAQSTRSRSSSGPSPGNLFVWNVIYKDKISNKASTSQSLFPTLPPAQIRTLPQIPAAPWTPHAKDRSGQKKV